MGEICCVLKTGSNVDSVECVQDCSGFDEDLICSAVEPCPAMMGICQPHADLPVGLEHCD
jgi:hypothetical protein